MTLFFLFKKWLFLLVTFSLCLAPLIAKDFPLIFEDHIPWSLEGAEARIEKFRKGNLNVKLIMPDGKDLKEEVLYKSEQIKHEFNFGGSLSTDWSVPATNWYDDFKKYFCNLFNYATVNFYWGSHEKTPGEWNYENAPLSRDIYNWALENKMDIKGHPLIWHQVLPDWIKDENRSVELIDKDVRNHIKRLILEFPEVDHWDTYNEVPGIRWEDENLGMRRWQEFIGNKIVDGKFVSGPGPVIEEVLDIARPLREDGYFVLNHYDHTDEYYHEQIQYCIDNDIQFEGIGIQTHMHNVTQSFSEDSLWEMLEFYKKYDKPIHLSEISVLSCGKYEDWRGLQVQNDKWDNAVNNNLKIPTLPSTPMEEAYQAALTRDFYILAFSHPSVEVITWWTMSDLDPWRGMPSGLLDTNGNPKPVYHELDNLINKEWKTSFSGKTNREGKFSFRGFFGRYKVSVKLGKKSYEGEFELSKYGEEHSRVMLKEIL